eukprot:750753-Prymnesium_polylepis.1
MLRHPPGCSIAPRHLPADLMPRTVGLPHAALPPLWRTPPADKPFVNTATVFVSHAWRYRAVDVFDAMEAFAAAAEQQEPGGPP